MALQRLLDHVAQEALAAFGATERGALEYPLQLPADDLLLPCGHQGGGIPVVSLDSVAPFVTSLAEVLPRRRKSLRSIAQLGRRCVRNRSELGHVHGKGLE